MGDVVALPTNDDRPELIWVCNCGCTVHHHHSNGDVECSYCRNLASISGNGEWRSRLPPLPDEPRPIDDGNFKTIHLDSAEMFLKGQAKRDTESVAMIVVVHVDGTFSTWGGGLPVCDRRQWMIERLGAVVDRMVPPAA